MVSGSDESNPSFPQSSPTDLSAVMFGDQPLTVTLTQIASLVVSAVPGADSAGLLAVLRPRGPS